MDTVGGTSKGVPPVVSSPAGKAGRQGAECGLELLLSSNRQIRTAASVETQEAGDMCSSIGPLLVFFPRLSRAYLIFCFLMYVHRICPPNFPHQYTMQSISALQQHGRNIPSGAAREPPTTRALTAVSARGYSRKCARLQPQVRAVYGPGAAGGGKMGQAKGGKRGREWGEVPM